MRKVSQYEQEKRLARAKQVLDVQAHPSRPADLDVVARTVPKQLQ